MHWVIYIRVLLILLALLMKALSGKMKERTLQTTLKDLSIGHKCKQVLTLDKLMLKFKTLLKASLVAIKITSYRLSNIANLSNFYMINKNTMLLIREVNKTSLKLRCLKIKEKVHRNKEEISNLHKDKMCNSKQLEVNKLLKMHRLTMMLTRV